MSMKQKKSLYAPYSQIRPILGIHCTKLTDVGSMLGQCHRQWANINPTLG